MLVNAQPMQPMHGAGHEAAVVSRRWAHDAGAAEQGKAAEQGNSDGAYNLAFCYAGGEGVEKEGGARPRAQQPASTQSLSIVARHVT